VVFVTKNREASKLICIIQSVGFAVSLKCGTLLPSLVLDSAKVGLFITLVANASNVGVKHTLLRTVESLKMNHCDLFLNTQSELSCKCLYFEVGFLVFLPIF